MGGVLVRPFSGGRLLAPNAHAIGRCRNSMPLSGSARQKMWRLSATLSDALLIFSGVTQKTNVTLIGVCPSVVCPKISIRLRWIKPSALFHHVTHNLLELLFDELKKDALSGVDGPALFNIFTRARQTSALPNSFTFALVRLRYLLQRVRYNFLVPGPVDSGRHHREGYPWAS